MTSADTSVAAAAGITAALGGSVIGIPIPALIAGMAGGLCAVVVVPPPPGPRPRGLRLYVALACSVIVSTLVGGFLGPWVAAWLDAPSIHDTTELLGASFLVGAGAQAGLLLTAIEALRRRIAALGGCP